VREAFPEGMCKDLELGAKPSEIHGAIQSLYERGEIGIFVLNDEEVVYSMKATTSRRRISSDDAAGAAEPQRMDSAAAERWQPTDRASNALRC
jgi:hypothetical protein